MVIVQVRVQIFIRKWQVSYKCLDLAEAVSQAFPIISSGFSGFLSLHYLNGTYRALHCKHYFMQRSSAILGL